jgi:hypothetical protein
MKNRDYGSLEDRPLITLEEEMGVTHITEGGSGKWV